jgi:hypothetical protein
MSERFVKFRENGWPFCPGCDKDGLCSIVLMMVESDQFCDVGREEILDGPFTCEFCGHKVPSVRQLAEKQSHTNSQEIGMNAGGAAPRPVLA